MMNIQRILWCVTITVILSIGAIPVAYSQHQMIADITQDVETEFGIYKPHLVTVTPMAVQYEVQPGFSNVVNFSEFDFTDREKELLRQNKFVVSPKSFTERRTGYGEIYDIYNECRELGIPIFVTTDALLHTFHLCFDKILLTIEMEKFIADLEGLLAALFDETVKQYAAANDSLVQAALLRNLDYLVVARTLLDSSYFASINGGKFQQELQLIREQAGYEISPLFGYEEDYSQYKPRGHYTRNDSLKHYFLCMMWLGRATFALESHRDKARSHTLGALLLLQALENSAVQSEAAHDVWERIYSPTVFFVGKTDDLNIFQYLEIAQRIYENFLAKTPDEFGNLILLDEFITEADKLPGPQITTETPKGFRLMGQRFVPDSWLLDELVFLKVPKRLMPKSLDVMTVLGSQRAHQLLDEMGEFTKYPGYAAKLNSLAVLFDNYPDEIWAQNLYWNWLYSLMPLLCPKSAGYPIFMQNNAWIDKELLAALGSWAELRHDTILYAKQSCTGKGGPATSDLIQGYVEPNPHFYARIASLADYFIAGLERQNLLFNSFKSVLEKVSELALSLKIISEKELTNRSLMPEEYKLINNFGQIIEGIAEFNLDTYGPDWESKDEMPVVADVHTETNFNNCLEVGVGYPFSIYVICYVEGELKVTRGAGFSYYEFILPISQRLTDEEWRTMLRSDPAPDLPYWTDSFIDSKSSLANSEPRPYFWEKLGFSGVTISLSADTIQTDDSLRITCQLQPPAADCPITIEVVGANTSTLINASTDQSGSVEILLSNFKPGQHWVIAGATFPKATRTSQYRTGFRVESSTGMAEQVHYELPEMYHLEQNYPNPFSPGLYQAENSGANTTIRFQLNKAARTKLIIYNICGEVVRSFDSGYKLPGRHEIQWNGMNQNGQIVAPGVYFYHLQIGAQSFSKKMVLIF